MTHDARLRRDGLVGSPLQGNHPSGATALRRCHAHAPKHASASNLQRQRLLQQLVHVSPSSLLLWVADRRRDAGSSPCLSDGLAPSSSMPFSTADSSIQLLRDTTNTLQEIESRMTARAFGAVHNPEKGPEGRRSGGCSKSYWRSWIAPALMG